LKSIGRHREAEEVLRRALADRGKVASKYPDQPDYQARLGVAANSLAELLRDQGRFAEVRTLAEQAIAHLQAAIERRPGNPTYVNWQCANYMLLVEALIHLGEHAKAAETMPEILHHLLDAQAAYSEVAVFLSRCVLLVKKDAELPEARREELARPYADRAVEMLREAAKRGYDARLLKEHSEFDPLRGREGFERLIRELESK
jgi:tetratricopeptide (TPR) repeat protein